MKLIIKKIKKILIFLLFIFIMLFVFTNSKTVSTAAKDGMLLCFDVIIPVLFPFLVLTLIISRSGIFEKLPFPRKYKHLQIYLSIFLLSNLGGYLIGAKLLSDAYISGKISEKDARLMLLCCINAGPAFSILAVGGGVLGSIQLGLLIYASQFLASITIFIIILKKLDSGTNKVIVSETLLDSFVSSVSDASISMLNMSGFIVTCSVALGIIKNLNILEPIKKIIYLFLEISNAILHTKNIYVLCFILGFAGFSIILQVFYFTKSFRPNKLSILISRFLNGFLSAIYAFFLIKLLSISVQTIGNTSSSIFINNSNSLILSFLLVLTCIAFLYSVTTKKYCGKFSTDIF